MTDRYKPYAAVWLILKKDNKILLSRRFNTGWMDGAYSLPSGHIDENESQLHAMVREAKEEINITLSQEQLSFAHLLHYYRTDRQYLATFFIASEWSGEVHNNEPDKCDDLSWFDLDRLPENIVPFIKHVLDQIKANNTYSELGWPN